MLSDPDIRDALAIARLRRPGLESYRLPILAELLAIPDFDHHDPGADSLACAHVLLTLAAESSSTHFDELWQEVLDQRALARRRARSYTPNVRAGDLPAANPDADPTHAMYGQVVCFSGELPGMDRKAARELVAGLGAHLSLNVTKKTTILVVGDLDPATLRAGESYSKKMRRALELAQAGQAIELMFAGDFLALVEA